MTEKGPERETYRVSRLTENGGWKPVERFEQLDTPITAGDFARVSGEIPPGTYSLTAVQNNLNKPTDKGWTVVRPDPESGTDHVRISEDAAQEAIRALERVMRHKLETSDDPDIDDPANARDELLFALETQGASNE